ncbi:motility associated factor glycosyltransferase family protein, partial [Campylobacter sp. VTCC 70190]|uniref:motility associated factor glycosyltransferase family protein n=1 Tax=Campylobacter sp. VTCC 70190 TaxID=3392118 RepID=UPI00398EB77E
VSTGPSLTKQLPLLKKYASKATIFCADSAYPILAKNDIKPDYVCVLERVVETAEFFNKPFKEFDEDIVFILKSVVHPKSVECMRKNGRDFMISSSYMAFVDYVRMDKFGYFASGFSVANMNYIIATHLRHKNIILIGQDLAYNDEGDSHPDGHVWGALDSLEKEDIVYDLKTKAYGGKGEVYTNITWNLFRNVFEHHIHYTSTRSGVKTYNCTEGGARIEGSIEKPFLWACENLLNEDLNKPFVKLEPLNLNKQNELMLKAYYKVYQSIKHCREFSQEFHQTYDKIKHSYLTIQNEDYELNQIIKDIDKMKAKIDSLHDSQKDLIQILGPLLTQFELNLARIYVLNPKTKEDSFNKSVLWIKEHLEFMELVYGHIKAQENALIKNIIPLEEKLKERGLGKWIKRVRGKSEENK